MKNGYISNFVIHTKKRNGEDLTIQINAHLINKDNDEIYEVEGTLLDITEKFKLEQDLKKSQEH